MKKYYSGHAKCRCGNTLLHIKIQTFNRNSSYSSFSFIKYHFDFLNQPKYVKSTTIYTVCLIYATNNRKHMLDSST